MVYVISIAVMILVPASQGLLIYCHWIKIPMFRDLEDLVSFRIPHGRNIQVRAQAYKGLDEDSMLWL